MMYTITFNSIKVCSYNCKNIKTSVTEIQRLCADSDILLLQETWLSDQELPFLAGLHSEFYSRGISAMDSSKGIHRGRPYGGLAILWRKSLNALCSISLMDDPRLLEITIDIGGIKLSVLNAYLPFDDGSNMEEYQSYLAKIDNCLETCHYSCAIGDFNANISGNSRFGTELTNYCDNENLVLSDKALAPADTFTFISEAHGTVGWIDHIVSTVNMHSIINQVSVDYTYVSSDHFPMFATINTNNINISKQYQENHSLNVDRINWSNVSEEEIRKYTSNSEKLLSSVRLSHKLLLCDDVNCTDTSHANDIDLMYSDIVEAIKTASNFLVKKQGPGFQQIPGWNDICADLHSDARAAFLIWQNNGKPRDGPVFQVMKSSRLKFKLSLRECKKEGTMKDSNTLAQKLLSKDTNDFWKEIKKIINRDQYSSIADKIDDATGADKITEMWQRKFTCLLNSNRNNDAQHLQQEIHCETDDRVHFSTKDIREATLKLKRNKASGRDGINGEHLKYAHSKLFVLLAMVFNSMIQHGHIPQSFMDTIIIPLIKDKKGDIGSSDNYRPIALTSVLSKVFESVMLEKCKSKLDTTPHQYGYKPKHGTELSIFTLKQIIDFYRTNSSTTYVCYLDLSKAFDRIDHEILLRKLGNRNVPSVVIRLLKVWFMTQKFCVQWGSRFSTSFNVSNGVRQGGVLSSYLFNIYIDELSLILNSVSYGCFMNSVCANHVIYADDTVLLAPSPTALQHLIDIAYNYFTENKLMLSAKKSKCMAIRPDCDKDIHIPTFYIDSIEIPLTGNHSYLGYIITDKFTDDESILKEVKSIYYRGNMLCRKFKGCNNDVKNRLFKAYCTTFYCASLWSIFKSKHLQRLQVAHNNIFRMLYDIQGRGSISMQFVARNVPNTRVIRRKLIYSLYTRVLCSNNGIVNAISNNASFIFSSLFNEWKSMLF